MSAPEIRKLVPSDHSAAIALFGHLNPGIPAEVLKERFETILAEHPHYHIFGAFAEGELAAVASAWIATKIWCGRYLEIDNLVVDPGVRSSGLGTALIRHLEEFAREEGCLLVVLDSYTSNHASHRLYHRLGFEIWGFHFVKPFGPLDR
ncbi:GNAT family N-acetyltransferase [Luteolibacter sp. Populi]|uniref:GNAT family N-acetyltransferase n=1 Tax=Luteolibacter sp. Populi TaxID=3230487 RepID=UPI003467BF1B